MSAPAASCSAAASGQLRFELVTEACRLSALAAAWQDLLDQSASAEPMLGPGWLLPWWEIYGAERALRVGLFYQDDELVGLAPLCWRQQRYGPGLVLRRLEFLGADVPENDGVCSEYLNLVVRAGHEDAIARAFVRQLAHGDFGPWDELVLPALAGDAALPRLLVDAFAEHDLTAELAVVSQAPYLNLPASWEEYRAGLSKKRRQALTYARRDLERWAEGNFAFRRVSEVADLPRGLQVLIDLHQQRWEPENGRGAFASARFRAFHERFALHLLEHGQLDLTWLAARGEPVAAQYNFVANGKVYFYQCGRRLDLPDHLSPGAVLLAHTIEEAIAAGRREFDFLAGPAPYKLHWTRQLRPIVQLRVARPCLTEYLRRAAATGKRWLRGVRAWFRKG